MGDSEETVKQNNEILKAIADLSAKFDEGIGKTNQRIDELENKFDPFQKSTDGQFETIRAGIVPNSIRFDRLESDFYKVRSPMSGTRADVKEMSEQVRRKEIV